MWKDTAMAAALLAALGMQLSVPRGRAAKVAWIGFYSLLLVYAVGVRVNALPAVMPLAAHCMWSALGHGRRWRLSLSLAFGVAVMVILGLVNTGICYGILVG